MFNDEDFEKYFDLFEVYEKKITETIKKNKYIPGISIGTLPEKIQTKNGTYTIIKDIFGQMCDDPNCCLMGNCMVNIKRYNGKNKPSYTQDYCEDFYSSIPVYTNEDKHELCYNCLMEKY